MISFQTIGTLIRMMQNVEEGWMEAWKDVMRKKGK